MRKNLPPKIVGTRIAQSVSSLRPSLEEPQHDQKLSCSTSDKSGVGSLCGVSILGGFLGLASATLLVDFATSPGRSNVQGELL